MAADRQTLRDELQTLERLNTEYKELKVRKSVERSLTQRRAELRLSHSLTLCCRLFAGHGWAQPEQE